MLDREDRPRPAAEHGPFGPTLHFLQVPVQSGGQLDAQQKQATGLRPGGQLFHQRLIVTYGDPVYLPPSCNALNGYIGCCPCAG